MFMKKADNKGFTLVELIVVLVILAILAAVLTPMLLGYIDDAKQKKELVNAKNCFTAIQTELTKLYGKGNLNLDKSDGNVITDDKPDHNTDISIVGTDFSKLVLAKMDSEPYCVLFSTGYYGKKNVDIKDCYTISYIFYMQNKDSEPLYYYNGEWTKRNPRAKGADGKESNDIIKKETGNLNIMMVGPLKGKAIRYYRLFDNTKKSWDSLWTWMKNMN